MAAPRPSSIAPGGRKEGKKEGRGREGKEGGGLRNAASPRLGRRGHEPPARPVLQPFPTQLGGPGEAAGAGTVPSGGALPSASARSNPGSWAPLRSRLELTVCKAGAALTDHSTS